MKPTTVRPLIANTLAPCAYCKAPGATAHIGQQGNPYTTCSDCTPAHARSVIASKFVERIEADRLALRAAGGSTPAYEAFVEFLVRLVGTTSDPEGALDAVLRVIETERAEACA